MEKKPRKPLSEEARRKMSEAAKNRSPEAEARRIAAMRASKKYQNRRNLPVYDTEEYREKQRQATLKKWENGVYEGRKEKNQATWASKTPEEWAEHRRNWSEGKKREWAEKGSDRNSVPGHLSGRVSEQELSLAPYLAQYGFVHNNANGDRICHIGRRVPDYVNFFDRKVFEYFGVRHHDPEDEQERIDYYAAKGWSCTVLWEYGLFTWLEQHQHLVTEEEHQAAWKAALCKRTRQAAEETIQREIVKRAAWRAARVNNGYRPLE